LVLLLFDCGLTVVLAVVRLQSLLLFDCSFGCGLAVVFALG